MPLRFPSVRRDLEYHEREEDGDTVVYVRDPIRNLYFRYNILQAAMLRALDGVRSYDDIVEELSVQFEVEIPRNTADQFVTAAKERMLLDINSYGVTPKQARKEVAKTLRRHGFRLRGIGGDSGPSARVASPEAVMFMGAIRHLQRGEPAKAADYLTAVLEQNPNNERARTLIALIQSAYVRAAGGMTDHPTWTLLDPSKILRLFDKLFGRIMFTPIGVTLLGLLMATAVYCAVSTDTFGIADMSFDTFDIATLVFFFVFHGLVHELGHGYMCFHYGGEVREIGVSLFYYFEPVFFCDTSSSYLFKERRHKMLVQLGGPLASFIFCSVQAVVLVILNPDVAIYDGMALSFVVGSSFTALNLIPFLKFDGYYLFCDIVGQTNLRDRSFSYAKAWLCRHVLGIPAEVEDLTPAEKRMFVVFAAMAMIFTFVIIYAIYFRMLAPLVEHWRLMGLVLALLLTYFLQLRHFARQGWLAVRLIARERRQIFTPRRSCGFALASFTLVAPWFLITRSVVFDAEFTLVPEHRMEVRTRAPGLVQEFLVQEGDVVKAGQPLARLRNDQLAARRIALVSEMEGMDAQLALLRAGASDEEVQLARTQVSVANAKRATESQKASATKRLAKAGAASAADADATARLAAETRGSAAVAYKRLLAVKAGVHPEEISAAEAQRARLASELEAVELEHELLVVRSPIDGTVVTKHLNDKLHTHLGAGDLLLEIHDLETFTAEIALPEWTPMRELEVGDEIKLVPYGAPDDPVAATLARLRDVAGSSQGKGTTTDGRPVVLTSAFRASIAISGMKGKARVYGREHTLAYEFFYLPLQRLFSIRLWAL